MEYTISVNEYELRTLIDLLCTQLKKELEQYEIFLEQERKACVELQTITINALYCLLGKLTLKLELGGE